MENFIKKVETMELKVSNEKINQTQRNNLKSEFIDALVSIFAEKGIDLHKTSDGLILKIEGNEHDIHIGIDAVVKGLDYDLVASIDEYSAKLDARVERQQALAKAKEKRLAEKSKAKVKSK
jgi:ribosome-associated translation inhibitor RaiA